MYIPDTLYFKPKKIRQRFTTEFTGQLDVNKAFNRDTHCWIKEDISGSQQKKTIVLSDFRFEQLSNDEATRLKQTLDFLVENGFRVSLWQKGELCWFNETNTELFLLKEERAKCTPTSNAQIIVEMAKMNITHKALAIMDIADMEDLEKEIKAQKPIERKLKKTIDVKDVIKSKFTVNEIVKTSLDPKTRLVTSSKPNQNERRIVKRLVEKYDLIVDVQYEKFIIESREDLEVYFKHAHEIKHLTIFPNIVTSLKQVLDKATQLETLVFSEDDNPTNSELQDIYETGNGYPTIKELNLSHYWIIHNLDSRFFDIFPNLIQVNVMTRIILMGDLINILTNSLKTKFNAKTDLTIRMTTYLVGRQELDAVLELLLQENVNLASLTLHDPSNTAPNKEKYHFTNTRLKQLVTYGFADTAFQLLSYVPNLNQIGIFSPSSLNWLHEFSFEKLTVLNLNYAAAAENDIFSLDTLHQFSPNLRELNLLMTIGKISPSTKPLHNLKSIHLRSLVENQINNFEVLIKCAPNLESLTITNSPGLSLSQAALYTIKSLKSLQILRINILKIPLFNLIIQLNQLEKLSISPLGGFETFNMGLSMSDMPEKLKLQEISFAISPGEKRIFAPEYLFEVIKRSPDLRILRLAGFENLDAMFINLVKTGAKFELLKTIDLHGGDLTPEGYKALRQIAPNVESINILGCPQISKIDVEDDETIELLVRDKNLPLAALAADKMSESGKKSGVPSAKIKGENRNESEHNVDVNTELDDKEYDLIKVFYNIHGEEDPAPNSYRLSAFNKLELGNNLQKPFHLSNKGDEDFSAYHDYVFGSSAEKELSGVYLGKHALTLSETFQALPSLDANERLTTLYVPGLNQDEIEVVYSNRDSLYYIRKKTPGEISTKIEFCVDTSNKPEVKENEAVKAMAKRFLEFGSGTLDLSHYSNPSGEDCINAMYKQQLGRCEQRAVMFKHFAELENPDLNIRVVENDCHTFVEVLQENQWIRYDLGGYPVNVKVRELGGPSTAQVSGISEFSQLHPEHVTWKAVTSSEKNIYTFSQQTLNHITVDSASGQRQGQNVLLQCENDSSVHEMLSTLQYAAKHSSRPTFVIDDPEQIRCAIRWLKREKDDSGTICPSPGGPLHAFLTQDFQGKAPVLIVNWNNFSADELVRFNTLIDETRHADGTPLPGNMVVVGLYNTEKPDAYKSSDFYSRNPIKLELPFSVNQIKTFNETHFPVNIKEQAKADDVVNIELYESINWKALLLGQWVFKEGKLCFEEGPLAVALKQGKSVHLANAPWHLEDFQRFWNEAKIHGVIPTVGEPLLVPDAFWQNLTQSKGYAWSELTTSVTFVENSSTLQNPLFINPSALNQFFEHFNVKNRLPVSQLSLFKNYENRSLDLVLTRELSASEWGKLLQEAKKYNVKLNIAIPEELELPQAFEQEISPKRATKMPPGQTYLEESSDVGFSVKTLKSTYPDALVIDVSEFDETDIFYTMNADFSKDDITFDERKSQVWKALKKDGQTVILKGHFTGSLRDTLAPFCSDPPGLWRNGKKVSFKGRLILVSDEPLSPAFAANKAPIHSPQEKLAASPFFTQLSPEIQKAALSHRWPASASYAQIEAGLLHYLHSVPPTFDISEGITAIAKKPMQSMTTGDFDLSESHVNEVCDAFIHKRFYDINTILSYAPFAFAGGQTGVGKSTFMELYLTPENGFKLYNEMSQLKAWGQDRTPGKIKVLFLDEANISEKNYTLLEGLYEIPPRLLVDGEIIELTPEHKVVLAGNPMSYGGERQIPTLLSEHGNACVFEAMPPEYIYREVLKPIFKAAGMETELSQKYCQTILKTYQQICSLSQEEILISPRELRMMAMMIITSENQSDENCQKMVFNVAEQCLPLRIKPLFTSWFLEHYPGFEQKPEPLVPPSPSILTPTQPPFILTASRAPIYESLSRLLKVRELTMSTDKKALKTPGLGGMVLEGEPGTGKSHFLIDALRQQGYADQFTYIPASLSFEEKKRIILEVFDKGGILVTDEINSGPMMEQLLNSVCMGVHPETKASPTKPGFLLLATQNPISMAGREPTSRALQRRLMFHEFSAYTPQEMKTILTATFSHVPEEKIDKHIQYHRDACRYAKDHHIEPAPVFRDLYEIIKSREEAILRRDIQQMPILPPLAVSTQRRATPILTGFEHGSEEHSLPTQRHTMEAFHLAPFTDSSKAKRLKKGKGQREPEPSSQVSRSLYESLARDHDPDDSGSDNDTDSVQTADRKRSHPVTSPSRKRR